MKLLAPQIGKRNEKTLTPEAKRSVCLHRIAPFHNIASYCLLCRAHDLITDPPWQLLVAGDGPARAFIEEGLYDIDREHVFSTDERDAKELMTDYHASDLFAWPAYNEAYGMALLEAVATSPLIIADNWHGKNEIVADVKIGVPISPQKAIEVAQKINKGAVP